MPRRLAYQKSLSTFTSLANNTCALVVTCACKVVMGIKIGFKFVPLPVEIWDDQIDISLAEFRLLGYLIRRQLRFGKQIKPLTHDELMNGQWRNGQRMDKGCGLSRNSLKQAISDLEDRKWIKVTDLSDNPRFAQIVVEVLISDDEMSKSDNQSSDSDNRNQNPSSDSDNQSAVSSSESDEHNKEVDKRPVDKNPVEEISPDMIARGVLNELGLAGRDLTLNLEVVARAERKRGATADDIRTRMIAAWQKYEQEKPKLEYVKGPAKFFGDGDWRDPKSWPYLKGSKKTDPFANMKFINSGGKK